MTVLDLVAAAEVPVLLWGAVPPEGRDYDLLCRAEDLDRLTAALAAAGFVAGASGARWVRVRDTEVDVVDVAAPERLGVPAGEVGPLFDTAEGSFVRTPAPAYELLLMTLKAEWGAPLPRHRRHRIDRALRRDPDGWEHAWDIAVRWGIDEDLERLKLAWRTGLPFEPLAAARPLRRRVRDRVRRHRRRPAMLVALSGLDGSGKSLQARLLREGLENLGEDVVIEWARLGRNASLEVLAAPVKALLRLSRRSSAPAVVAAPPPSGPTAPGPTAPGSQPPGPPSAASDAGQALRSRSQLVATAWALVVAVVNGLTYQRIVRRHLRAGRSVILDRYVLDSCVHVRFRYAGGDRIRGARTVLRLLAPAPAAAYWLDVRPEVAAARKADEFSVAELAAQRDLYADEATGAAVRRVDGEQPVADVFAELMTDLLARRSER